MVKEYFATVSAPKTEMFTIPYAAHSPQADNPKEFWNVIGAILFNLFNEPEGAVLSPGEKQESGKGLSKPAR